MRDKSLFSLVLRFWKILFETKYKFLKEYCVVWTSLLFRSMQQISNREKNILYARAHGKCTVSLIYDTSLNWVSLIPLLEKFQDQKMWKFSLKSRHFVFRCLWKMQNIGNSWHNFGVLWFILSNTTTIFWGKCHQEINENMHARFRDLEVVFWQRSLSFR